MHQLFSRHGRRLKALERVFVDSEARHRQGLPLRITALGQWVPMPHTVLVALLTDMKLHDVFRRPLLGRTTVVDAGTGDGRVLAALAHVVPELDVVGIESDVGLYHRANANLETLTRNRLVDRPERLRVIRGDYRRNNTYELGAIQRSRVGFVFNYPDGNQEALAQFVVASFASGTKLCLLTHDSELRLSTLELEEHVVSNGWAWSIYSS
ncbi:MAG TPA: hypothetical protein VLK65_01665 [Vicinamibacteria bacterium]|nr:hypothetical protein [Vicinamibacteria bacterium]